MLRLSFEHSFLFIDADYFPDFFVDYLKSNFSYTKRSFNVFKNKMEFKRNNLFRFVNGNRVCMPKGYYLPLLAFLHSKPELPYILVNSPKKLNANISNLSNFSFRPTQKECVDKIIEFLSVGSGGVVVAPPAYGKSHLFSTICLAYSDYKIDIVSKRRDVVFGIYNTLNKYINDVGLITSGYNSKSKITVYTANSLHHSDYDADLLLLDEVHELVTDSYYRVLGRYGNSLNLGFTATPDTRFDNLHKRMEALCGPIIYNIEYSEAESVGTVVPIVVCWIPFNMKYDPIATVGNIIERKRIGIWNNDERNKLIAEYARKSLGLGLQTLVLVETIEHALNLKRHLPEFEVCYAGSSYLEGSVADRPDFVPISDKRRVELREAFAQRKIMGAIATGVWAVGVSFDSLEVLIRADGSASLTAAVQSPGRVARISPSTGKQCGIVIDIEDNFNDNLHRRVLARKRMYTKKGWTQIRGISWD